MEEIDIIELLKRVKEGKAPKEIEVDNRIYKFNWNPPDICKAYIRSEDGYPFLWLTNESIDFNTKIKILDKPIIEKIDITNKLITNHAEIIITKLNEVIDYINNKENKDE